jgi:hypothetical protein
MSKQQPSTTNHVLVNYSDSDKQEKGKMHAFLFANGEMIIESERGQNIFLTRAQVVDLYTFFDTPRVKARMRDVLRAYLVAAGGVCREIVHWIDRQATLQ